MHVAPQRTHWDFPNPVASNLVVCNVYSQTLFCALLHPFALFCAHLRPSASDRPGNFETQEGFGFGKGLCYTVQPFCVVLSMLYISNHVNCQTSVSFTSSSTCDSTTELLLGA